MSKIISFDEGSKTLQKGIKKLQNILEGLPEPNFTPEQHIMLYTTVYDMCTQKPPRNYPGELYNMYKETCQEYIISKVYEEMDKEIMDAISAMVDRNQAGEQVDQSFALNTLDLYLELKECTRKIKEKVISVKLVLIWR
ncbi:hypothetical protein TSUD_202620 [Trifolium subterraneum]|uniref:Cullin N-terminal domain-containing protein n=1 Tax=Trifolium subterraneum TaxID=3900 RepID=A0A2Z6M868_TRISU|nr:hypothetical protein TSUD_202620 [Trifolium subterraneum]